MLNWRRGFKLYNNGIGRMRNGLSVILKENHSKSVVEVKRVSERFMSVKLGIGGAMMNVVTGSSPQLVL